MKSYIAVDVGGTKILTGLVETDGCVRAWRRYPMKRGSQEEALEAVFSACDDFVSSLSGQPQPAALGLGTVGHIDPERGLWLQSYNIPISRPVELGRLLEARYGLPSAIDNDVRCAARGEWAFGGGQSHTMLYLNVGTGIGSALISQGKLMRGADNYAGEVGYMVMGWEGEPQRLEPLASGGGLIASARAMLPQFPESLLNQGELHAEAIFAAAREGDALADFLSRRAVGALGAALANLACAHNPDTIRLGGSVAKDPWFLDCVEQRMRALCLPETLRGLKSFSVSSLDPAQVGMLGAGALAMEVFG